LSFFFSHIFQGTGANRAVLSSMDTAWMLKHFFGDNDMSDEQLLNEATQFYKIMVCAEPKDLYTNGTSFSIDPESRYKQSTHSHFH